MDFSAFKSLLFGGLNDDIKQWIINNK